MSKAQPIDVRDMAFVHRTFGDLYEEAARLVRAALAPSPGRVTFLADHIDFGIMMLHVHHEGEDDLLYPKLGKHAVASVPATRGACLRDAARTARPGRPRRHDARPADPGADALPGPDPAAREEVRGHAAHRDLTRRQRRTFPPCHPAWPCGARLLARNSLVGARRRCCTLGGQLAPFTAGHDEVTPGAGPLRAIPVRSQVALPALRALLAPGRLAMTHQHTVTRDRAGVTRPRPLPAPASHNPGGRGPACGVPELCRWC